MHASRTLQISVGLATAVLAAFSPSPLVVLLAGSVLVLGVSLLWPPNDAPILLLPFGLQWVPVALKPIETAFIRQPLDALSDFGGSLAPGAIFGLLGVASFTVGLRLAQGPNKVKWNVALSRDAARWSTKSLVMICLAVIVIGHALDIASNYVGPARQVFLAFAGIRFAGLFILALHILSTGRALPVLAAVTAVEVGVGLTGFFASFREPLLVLMIAAATARPRFGFGSIAVATIALSSIMVVTIFWSAVKPEYRRFMNEGSGAQVVTQPLAKRIDYISRAADQFDGEDFERGLTALVKRASYIDFLAKTIEYVPAYTPHQNGRQLGQAVLHIVTPRILFPDKPITPHDTDVTARYTGLNLDTFSGASISIGYLGELYIDFGYVGGLIGSLGFGLLAGYAYRLIRGFKRVPLLISYGIAVMALLPLAIFETALIKYLGSIITVLAAAFVLQRLIAPKLLPSILRERPVAA